jgi:hypothetical protein
MVIKDNKLREKLWNLHFVDGLPKKECVAKFTGAKLACVSEIYATLTDFGGRASWHYSNGHSVKGLRAGGLTQEELSLLKHVIDEDTDRTYEQAKDELADRFHVTVSIKQISIAVNTSVKKGGLGYSSKVKQFAAAEKDHVERRDFIRFLNAFLPELDEAWHKVVFFDEMHRSLREGERRRTLGPKGIPSVVHRGFCAEIMQTFTLFGALNTSGILESTPWICKDNVDSDIFYLWVFFFLCPMLGDFAAGEPNSIVLCGACCKSCVLQDCVLQDNAVFVLSPRDNAVFVLSPRD